MASIKDKKNYKHYSAMIGGKEIFPHDFAIMLKCSNEDLLSIERQWDVIEKENRDVARHNQALRSAIVLDAREFFARAGIEGEDANKRNKPSKPFAAIVTAIDDKIRITSPYNRPSMKPVRHEGKDYWSNETTVSGILRDVKAALQREVDAANSRQLEFAKAGALAAGYGIALDDPALVSKVTEANKQEWIAQNYPAGTEVGHSSCDDCETWTVGERRCACGNRRMYLIIEGSIGNWIAYPAAD